MPTFAENAQAAIEELIREKKVTTMFDMYALAPDTTVPKSPPPPQQPPASQEPPPPQQFDKPSEGNPIDPDLLKILIEDSNAFNLIMFLGYSPSEAEQWIKKKIKFVTTKLPKGVAAAADTKNNVIYINTVTMIDMIKSFKTGDKPYGYWYSIYVLTHELLHIINQGTDDSDPAVAIDEALVPITEYEFYVPYNGATNPFLIDISDDGIVRMSMKKDPTNRIAYHPLAFFYFDQLMGFLSLNPPLFLKAMQEFGRAGGSFMEKVAVFKKYYYFDDGAGKVFEQPKKRKPKGSGEQQQEITPDDESINFED